MVEHRRHGRGLVRFRLGEDGGGGRVAGQGQRCGGAEGRLADGDDWGHGGGGGGWAGEGYQSLRIGEHGGEGRRGWVMIYHAASDYHRGEICRDPERPLDWL